MLLEILAELKDNIDKHGIRWGLVLTLYAIYRKERRNYRLDQRDIFHNAYFAAILANQRVIMDKLGVGAECADISNLTKSPLAHHGAGGFIFYWAENSIAQYAKRFMISNMRRMNELSNINKAMLLPLISTLLLIIKSATGYEVPIPNADLPVDCILSVGTIIGYFMHPTGQPIAGIINKALIMPIFASIGLILSLITHHSISNDLVNAAADFVVYGLALWGQFMHPVKEVTTYGLPQPTNTISSNK